MGVITPAGDPALGTLQPVVVLGLHATIASKVASARPRRLSGSQKIPGRALVSVESGAHDRTACDAVFGTGFGGLAISVGTTAIGFDVKQVALVVLGPATN